jgi:hypothetical protein
MVLFVVHNHINLVALQNLYMNKCKIEEIMFAFLYPIADMSH